jgi:GON domain
MPSPRAFVMLVPMMAGACGAVNDPSGDDDAPAGLASSCVQLGAGSSDKNVRLYVDGDETKPYSAHCSADLKTYIPLEGPNLSSYPVGGCGVLASNATAGVTTTWQMVRFDTTMHAIDTSDYMFATSTGGTHESSGNGSFEHDFLSIPFGSGRSCTSGMAQTVATIDLTGTHFALAAAQTWAADGFSAGTDAAINPQRTKAMITATGFPVGTSPCAPNSDYYTLNGGTCLQLEYVP